MKVRHSDSSLKLNPLVFGLANMLFFYFYDLL